MMIGLFCALLQISLALDCTVGVSILTRRLQTENSYILQQKCICPSDHYGDFCHLQVELSCILIGQQVESLPTELRLTFGADCYVKTQFHSRPLAAELLFRQNAYHYGNMEELSRQYPGIQIVWANDTRLFDPNGNIYSNQTSNLTEDQIIRGSGPYSFSYDTVIFGLEFTDSTFAFLPKVIMQRYAKNSIQIPLVKVDFIEAEKALPEVNPQAEKEASSLKEYLEQVFPEQKQQIQGITTEISKYGQKGKNNYQVMLPLGRFSLEVNPQYVESETIRVELSMIQKYGDFDQVTRQVSVIPANWRVKIAGVGLPSVLSTNSKSMSLSLQLILESSAVVLLLVLVKLFPYLRGKCRSLLKRRVKRELIEEGVV